MAYINNLQEKSGQTLKRLVQDVDDYKALNSLKVKESNVKEEKKGTKRKRRRKSSPDGKKTTGSDKRQKATLEEKQSAEYEYLPDEELFRLDAVDSLEVSDSSSEEITHSSNNKKRQRR